MALLAGRLLPARVQVAIGEGAEAARLYAACRGPQYAEARQHLQARLRAANKVLAAYSPGLIIRLADLSGLHDQQGA
ncbi:hypothetical protein ACFZAO_05400 [Streptomyces griseoaurantiacus]|uniref:hypothetical protein n=1 Tax=Streptomyces griseoaurantiacus TaxID=68213 RepID=UPI0036EE92CE